VSVTVCVVDTRLATATLSGTGAHVYTPHGLAGRGDRYQCSLDWGRSSMDKLHKASFQMVYEVVCNKESLTSRSGPFLSSGKKSIEALPSSSLTMYDVVGWNMKQMVLE